MNGTKTTEFWVAAIAGIIAAVLPLLVAYGVLTSELAELWKGVIMAIVAAVIPIVVGSIAKNYTSNRTALKIETVAMEAARCEAMQRGA